MSFNINDLTSRQTGNTGIPEVLSYGSATDTLETILTNGYFPWPDTQGMFEVGDFLSVLASDGNAIVCFGNNTSTYVPVYPIHTIPFGVNTITAASGTLKTGQ